MAWRIEFGDAARKQLSALDRVTAKRVLAYLRERVAFSENPRALGQPLKGSEFAALWRYRIGDYRVIAKIEDEQVTVLILRVAHRRDIYR